MEIDIASVMDTLRVMAVERGVDLTNARGKLFNQAFLDSVRRHGRAFELETLLFRTITVGFVLLSLTLLTGLLFVQDFLAQRLLHKTVLSILSWIVFGALLIGRWRNGWRGTKAVHWTLTAMALLVLSFFGSKFVIELVLGPR